MLLILIDILVTHTHHIHYATSPFVFLQVTTQNKYVQYYTKGLQS